MSKKHILEIIENEFQLVFDLDDLLERIDGAVELLNFETFSSLFDIDDEKGL